jgi:hypothetical protein
MKTYWGSGSIAPRILRLRHYMEMSGQLHVLAALHTGREPLAIFRVLYFYTNVINSLPLTLLAYTKFYGCLLGV